MRNVLMLCAVVLICFSAAAQDAAVNSYTVTPIVTNANDANLINPWGLSRPVKSSLPENEWWASDQMTGVSTLYDANGTIKPLIITIPPASGSGKGSPTGTAFNANNFAFVTTDGTVQNWFAGTKPAKPGTQCAECHTTTAVIMVNNAAKKASYTGMTVASNTYFVANSTGGVEAYNANTFAPVTLNSGAFVDPNIPTSYTPFGIQAIGSDIYVTFYNSTAGGGYVDAFDPAGKLLLSLAHGQFSEPWGVVKAPANFGAFSGAILVGNTASGKIGAYNATSGKLEGFMKTSTGSTIVIPGLWGLSFGNGSADSGPTTTLYYNAGGNYLMGTFGAVTFN